MTELAKLDPRKSQYFTSYHLARDLYGNLLPFTFLVFLASLLFSPSAEEIVTLLEQLEPQYFTGLAIVFVPVYILSASMAGILALHFYGIVFNILRRRFYERMSYGRFYTKSKGEIESLYSAYFANQPALAIDNTHIGEKVDRLCLLMKQSNPEGYGRLYRAITFVLIFRQSIFYVFGLLLVKMATDVSGRLLFYAPFQTLTIWTSLLTFLVALWLGCRQGVRYVVKCEFDLIVVTSAWLDGNNSNGA